MDGFKGIIPFTNQHVLPANIGVNVAFVFFHGKEKQRILVARCLSTLVLPTVFPTVFLQASLLVELQIVT